MNLDLSDKLQVVHIQENGTHEMRMWGENVFAHATGKTVAEALRKLEFELAKLISDHLLVADQMKKRFEEAIYAYELRPNG